MKITVVSGFNNRAELQFDDIVSLTKEYPELIIPGQRIKSKIDNSGSIYPCIPSRNSEVKIGDRVEIISKNKVSEIDLAPKKAKKLFHFFVRKVPEFKLEEEAKVEKAAELAKPKKPKKKIDISILTEKFGS